MKIQIDGTNTVNKGAELMLYAVLEQIENRHPEATVIFNDKSPGIRPHNIKTGLRFIKPLRLKLGHYPWALLSKLNLPYVGFTELYPEKNIDLILDANGFRLGDHLRKPKTYYQNMENYYRSMKDRGTIIILLPQAFGPFETEDAKKSAEIINNYTDLIIARETTSENHLTQAGVDPKKIRRFPDFTISAKGVFPEEYHHVKGGVCIIPNTRMVTQTRLNPGDYYEKMEAVITRIQQSDKQIFLLNHEGKEDLDICREINRKFGNRFTVISGLNSKEIKGVIGSAYMVISSRYHGVVSALNQGIPCLATSWSHKYQLLFDDFKLKDHIIDLEGETDRIFKKVDFLMDPDNHAILKKQLLEQSVELRKVTGDMWKEVWQIAETNKSRQMYANG